MKKNRFAIPVALILCIVGLAVCAAGCKSAESVEEQPEAAVTESAPVPPPEPVPVPEPEPEQTEIAGLNEEIAIFDSTKMFPQEEPAETDTGSIFADAADEGETAAAAGTVTKGDSGVHEMSVARPPASAAGAAQGADAGGSAESVTNSGSRRRTYSEYGYFFTAPQIGPFTVIEAEFKKLGGYEKSAFGFVFSYTADNEGWLSDYMRFEINTAGQYGIYQYDGAQYTDLAQEQAPDTAYLYGTDVIQGGYNTANRLRIEDNGDGTCTISINGTQMAVVKLAHGKIGRIMPFFSVGKADQERLPDEPVIVTYRITEAAR